MKTSGLSEICESLYQQFVLKMKVKDDNGDSMANVDIQSMLNRPKTTVMQPVAISNSPPPGLVVTAAAQGNCIYILFNMQSVLLLTAVLLYLCTDFYLSYEAFFA